MHAEHRGIRSVGGKSPHNGVERWHFSAGKRTDLGEALKSKTKSVAQYLGESSKTSFILHIIIDVAFDRAWQAHDVGRKRVRHLEPTIKAPQVPATVFVVAASVIFALPTHRSAAL